MGAMTVVKISEAIGKRTIQTRWVDRGKDGRVKSRLVLKDYNRCQGRSQPEMFSPTPSTLSLKTMLAASSHDRNSDPDSDHITRQDKTTAPQKARSHSSYSTTTKKCLIAFGETNSSQSETALCSAVLAQNGTYAMVSMVPWTVPGQKRLDNPSNSAGCLATRKRGKKNGSDTERMQAEALHIKIGIVCTIEKRVPGLLLSTSKNQFVVIFKNKLSERKSFHAFKW